MPIPDSLSPPDETLVRWAQWGRLDAYDVLVQRHRLSVLAIVRPLVGTREVAEDVVQDAFLAGYRNIGTLREPDRFGAWLIAIARRRALLASGQERRDRTVLQEALDEAVLNQSRAIGQNETGVLRRAELERVWAALRALPAELREPLALYALRELSLSQIAGLLDVPLSTVKWRMHEARRRLRRQLGEPGDDNHVQH
ncbi:MAG: RNA polymerase sigma factor [Fimbriimonadaceae bacterium]|nr:RNA polymerase sigma factor [Fimbriimonadaceae bacterium]